MIKSYLCQFCGIERDDGWHDCFHALKALVRELKPERDEALRMERQAHARVAGLEAENESLKQSLFNAHDIVEANHEWRGVCPDSEHELMAIWKQKLVGFVPMASTSSEAPIASRGQCPKCGGYFPAAGGTVGPHECLGAERDSKDEHG